jgi:hypothetical protein
MPDVIETGELNASLDSVFLFYIYKFSYFELRLYKTFLPGYSTIQLQLRAPDETQH